MNSLAVRRWLLAVALLLAGCASRTPPPPPIPPPTEVPEMVLNMFCAQLHDEGVSVETTVDVVSKTQKLVTPDAVAGLAEAAFYAQPFDPVGESQKINHDFAAINVAVPHGPCAWHQIDEHGARANDIMTIELSSPFRNPFARNAYGLLARLSLARESATWYWVPLGQRNGQWLAGRPTLLGMR